MIPLAFSRDSFGVFTQKSVQHNRSGMLLTVCKTRQEQVSILGMRLQSCIRKWHMLLLHNKAVQRDNTANNMPDQKGEHSS